MEFYLSNETIKRSKFRYLKKNDKINLELPLRYGQKISGHICQGHVDTVGKIMNIKKIDKSYLFDFEIIAKERKNIIEKASICKCFFLIKILSNTYQAMMLIKEYRFVKYLLGQKKN